MMNVYYLIILFYVLIIRTSILLWCLSNNYTIHLIFIHSQSTIHIIYEKLEDFPKKRKNKRRDMGE